MASMGNSVPNSSEFRNIPTGLLMQNGKFMPANPPFVADKTSNRYD